MKSCFLFPCIFHLLRLYFYQFLAHALLPNHAFTYHLNANCPTLKTFIKMKWWNILLYDLIPQEMSPYLHTIKRVWVELQFNVLLHYTIYKLLFDALYLFCSTLMVIDQEQNVSYVTWKIIELKSLMDINILVFLNVLDMNSICNACYISLSLKQMKDINKSPIYSNVQSVHIY